MRWRLGIDKLFSPSVAPADVYDAVRDDSHFLHRVLVRHRRDMPTNRVSVEVNEGNKGRIKSDL
jgi:hypothetical protein